MTLSENAHISDKKFTPISRKQAEALINLLKKSGLAENVIADEAKMREYLEKHLGKEGTERFMTWYHGSPNNFDKFERINAFTRSYDGIYFSNDKNIPIDYGNIRYEVELPELSDEQKPFNEKDRKSIDAHLDFSSRMRENYADINFDANTGKVITQLENKLGSVEAAHNWLMRAGVDGYMRKSEADGRNAIIFNDKAIKIKSKTDIRLMATPKGEVYGFVAPGGNIYLDPKKLNANTPIHEFGHLWCDFVENHNPELWLRITELTKETPYFKEVLNNPAYANLKDDNARINEAFAQAIGDEGERVFHNKDINLSFKDKFKKLLNNFWSWTGEKLGIRDLTPEEISRLTFEPTLKGAIADITDGKPMFPLKIGGVKLTAKQRDVLATGGTIQMTGLINKKGQKFTADMRWNFRENKPEYINGRQIKEPLKEKMKNSYRKKI